MQGVTDVITVGQKLWWVGSSRYAKREYVIVEKVGRKWVTLSNRHRINKETLDADGGVYVSPGRCYLSEEDHAKELRTFKAFNDLRNRLAFSPRDGVTEDDIIQAAKLLRIEIKE